MNDRISSAKSQLAKLIEPIDGDTKQRVVTNEKYEGEIEKQEYDNGSQRIDDNLHQGMNKTISDTSTCAMDDKSSSFDTGIQGKMEKLMARTKNIQQKLISQLQTTPKVLTSNTRTKADKPFKNFQKVNQFREQLQNQPAVKQSCEDRKTVQLLDTLWRQVLCKSFDSKTIQDDTTPLFSILKKWKQNSANYQIIRQQMTSTIESPQQIQLPKLVQSFLKEKIQLFQQLNTVKNQIIRLTNVIAKLQSDRSFYLDQINERDSKINVLDSEVERLKLNNNCLTEIIYKLQQKRAQNQMRVQRDVYQHLQEQNQNLKKTLAKIVEENKILTRALTQEIKFVRQAILDEIKRKMLLRADLLKAEETIEELRNMSQMDLSGIKNTIFKEFKLDQNQVFEQILPKNLNFETQSSQQVSVQGKLLESNDYITQLEGMLDQSKRMNGDFQKQKQRLEGLVRKQQYEKQHFRRQIDQIKKALFQGQSILQTSQPIQLQLSSILQRVVQFVYQIKNLKQRNSILSLESQKGAQQLTKLINQYDVLSKRFMAMRLQKNPSGNEQKLIQLQNINAQLIKQTENMNGILRNQQQDLIRQQDMLRGQYDLLLQKDEQIKSMLETIDKLIEENKKLQEEKEAEIVNPEREFDQNDLVLQLQANLSECKRSNSKSPNRSAFLDLAESKINCKNPIKRMKSLSICSQSDHIIEDIPTEPLHSNVAKSIGHKSEISDCWNNTSGIHELAQRIDSQGILSFKIQELLQKYNLRGDISQVLSVFLKKLDRIQNIQQLCSNIQEMLCSFKGLSDLQEDNNFLKYNLSKMQDIFSKTRVYLSSNIRQIDPDLNQDDYDNYGLTLQSVIDN